MGERIEFTSRLEKREAIAALVYLPVHVFLLPVLLGFAVTLGLLEETSDAALNLIYYGVGIVYMFLFLRRFLRRDFDPLCDRPLRCLLEICICYGLMLVLNLCVNRLLSLMPLDNPNNAAISDMAGMEYGKVAAMAVFMAPIIEELMFRAGIFGLLRRCSRVLGYAVSIVAFSLYHVWSYALWNPSYWIYALQYVPVSYLLCRCYEKTNSIWSSIFLHMFINGVSVRALMLMEELL